MINSLTNNLKIEKLLFAILLLLIVACNGKNKELQKKVDNKIAELDSAIKLNAIRISVEPIPEKELSTAFKDKSNYSSSFFDSLEIETTNRFPNSFFLIDYDEFELVRLLT